MDLQSTEGGGDSRGPVLLAVSVSTTSLAFLICGVRAIMRLRISRTIGWDDYAIYLAMLMGAVAMILTVLEGVHDSVDDEVPAMMFDYLAAPWLGFGSTLAKISICFFFLRTIGKARPWNYLLGLLIVILAILNLVFAMVSNLQCRPLQKLWIPSTPGSCMDPSVEMNLGFIQGGFAVFSFFLLALFPILMIRDMGILKNIRWPFYSMSFLTLTAGFMSIVKTYETSTINSLEGYSYNVFIATLLAIFIQNLGIIGANILVLGPLFSADARELSHIDDDSELLERRSIRSFQSGQSSTTLIIEGTRKMGHSAGSIKSNKEGGKTRISIQLNHLYALEEGLSSEALNKGILKTVSVEVVEEDITEADRISLGAQSVDDDWQNILRGGPRSDSRASGRE